MPRLYRAQNILRARVPDFHLSRRRRPFVMRDRFILRVRAIDDQNFLVFLVLRVRHPRANALLVRVPFLVDVNRFPDLQERVYADASHERVPQI